MAAMLAQLINVRSQLAEAALDYLTQLADRLDQTGWWRGSARLKASEIAVEPFVFTMRKRERPARSGPDRERRETDVERRSPMDEIEAERYELPVKVEEREEERWRQVVRRGRVRLGLKGAPGSGKTFTTRQTMVALAREAAAQLERRQVGVEEVELPVWVTAKHLAQTGGREIEETLLEAMENGLAMKLSPNLRAWLKREIVSARAFIVVDALDELLESDRAPFEAKSKQLDGLNARVIATCRTMQWEERKDWLGWGSLTEVELAPFKRRQQREFTGRFFERQPDLAQNMERLLQVNFALRHACTTPLLITFACLLHEEGKVNESTSYAGLYGQMGRLMFSGCWRGVKPDWTSNRVREESCWRFFEDIAWRLFAKAPQLNRFTLDDWRRAAGQATEGGGAVAAVEATAFLEELERVGMIVPAGFDEQRADLCWSFAHRTFLEFLAARALSRMEQQMWLAEVKQHFWFQPEWLEVLSFLAGLVDDVTPLVEAIDEEEDDLFGSMLYLKARLIGNGRKVDGSVVMGVCGEVFSFWRETLSGWRHVLEKYTYLMFSQITINPIASNLLSHWVIQLTWENDQHVIYKAVSILCNIRNEEVMERLLVLANEGLIYEKDLGELGKIGDYRTGEFLLGLLLKPQSKDKCKGIAMALGDITNEHLFHQLLELTKHESYSVWKTAIEALGNIGNKRAIDWLLELFREAAITRNWQKGEEAAKALGKIGDERAARQLIQWALTEEEQVRRAAANSLLQLNSFVPVDILSELADDESKLIRGAAAEVLGTLSDELAVDKLLQMTRDTDSYVKNKATRALGNIGNEKAVDRLLELLQEDSTFALEALGKIGDHKAVSGLLGFTNSAGMALPSAVSALGEAGDPQAIERIMELTHHWDVEVVWAALKALGDIRDSRALTTLIEFRGLAPDVSEAAVSMGKLGDQRAFTRLLELTRHSEGYVRASASEALGKIGDAKAVSRLIELMKQHDDFLIEIRAADALWRIEQKHKMPVRDFGQERVC